VGQFKERKIQEKEDMQLDIFFLQKAFLEQEAGTDQYSLFLPNYEIELGGLLPHEKSTVPAQHLIESLRKIS
jgi:hypothetical protein